MKFRVWSNKYKMYHDDAMWPNNQRSMQLFFLDPNGKLHEMVWFSDTPEECLTEVTIDKNDYVVELISGGKKTHKDEKNDR